MLRVGLIFFILVFFLSHISLSQAQENFITDCNDKFMMRAVDTIFHEKQRNDYKLNSDAVLKNLESLPKGVVNIFKKNFDIEILIENQDTIKDIEYKNCSHFESVKLELMNVLKQGEDEWNEYWKNQETDLSKSEIKQIKEYIYKYVDTEKK